jgi:hypothetical protein
MAKDKLIVNGYKVPSAWSGVAVRYACERVLASPGISQVDLLQESTTVSGLNIGTAGWLTSPGPKSPATLLWDRRKERVFRCYPNEFTEKVTGYLGAIREEITRFTLGRCKMNRVPEIGELVQVRSGDGYHHHEGVVLGFVAGDDPALHPSVTAALSSMVAPRHYQRVGVALMETGTNKIHYDALGWEYRPL